VQTAEKVYKPKGETEMAEFTAGDRVVKMSGIAAGKYGTVNSVREDGTLNVTFDGERMARFCDPERCGKVAANDKKEVARKYNEFVAEAFADSREDMARRRSAYDNLVSSGDRALLSYWRQTGRNSKVAANAVKFDNPNYRPADGIKYLDEHFQMFDPKVAKAMIDDAKAKGIKIPMSLIAKAQKAGIAANAKFKVGDVVHRASTLGVDPKDLKILKAYRRNVPGIGFVQKYDVQLPDGTVHPDEDERWFVRANSRAANREFAPGDKVCIGGRAGMERGEKVETIERVEGEGNDKFLFFKGSKWGMPARMYAYANSRACNRASVFEYGVGDTVKLRSGRTGEVLSKYVDKDGNLSIEINLNGTRYAVSADMVDSVVKNARACNAVARNFTEDQLRKYLTYRYYSYKGNLYFTGSEESAPVWVLYDDKRDGEKWTLRACKNRGVEAMLSKAHPEWNFCQISDLQRKQNEEAKIRKIVEAELRKMGKTIANAEITPELKKAYDEWQKAKAKFDKWWNPNRRLSERPPKGADYSKYGMAFSDLFFKEYKRRPPNGYGSMTLEQMVDAVSKNAVARNGDKRLRTAQDKNGKTIRVGDKVKIDDEPGYKKVASIWEYDGEGPYVLVEGSYHPLKSYLFVTKI
jgi:preprotein translocase subunit YajC